MKRQNILQENKKSDFIPQNNYILLLMMQERILFFIINIPNNTDIMQYRLFTNIFVS